jgi:2-dehydro-3-deoxy-D-arabinonate dehydratase
VILLRTTSGAVVEHEGRHHAVPGEWDALVDDPGLPAALKRAVRGAALPRPPRPAELLAPIGRQEVWAAGVTYQRSRTARMSESRQAGGSDFYDRVYHAERPELFMKATPHRVVGPGAAMHLRRDSRWIVPEPELTLAVDSRGRIFGYTIGNDLSCRDIEGENPLYLPQAKSFTACAALGPGILISGRPLPRSTRIAIEIRRRGASVFRGETRLSEMRKPLRSLVDYLYRDNSFPVGCLLMTGTGIVPPGRFSLRRRDEVRITIEPIGTLVNVMD